MQYAVPQFTDVEDKLIGPLTLKQFLMLLGTGGIILFFWSFLRDYMIVFVPIALLVGLFGAFLTFGKYNSRPFFIYLFPFISYLSKPKVMAYHRDEGEIHVSKMEIKKPEVKKETPTVASESTESRLKKLAYLLDQKAAEEQEIIQGKPNEN